jgi:hypothetical protein
VHAIPSMWTTFPYLDEYWANCSNVLTSTKLSKALIRNRCSILAPF